MDRITAIIPAAGQGRRMASSINKQFILLRGKPVIVHTLEVFDRHPLIDKIIVVVASEALDYFKEEIINEYHFSKEISVVIGGQERQDSVYNGLKAVRESGLVIIHDGARPFLTPKTIDQVIEATKKWGAAVVGMPVKDTVKIINQEEFVKNTPERSKLWLVQTPQGFNYELLIQAYEKAKEKKIFGTDDSSLVEMMGKEVKMIRGSYENIKITTPEDLAFGQVILERRYQS